MKKEQLAFLIASISFFLFSFFQDCFCTASNCINSFSALIFGFLGLLMAGTNLCWLANPLLLFSWMFFYFNTKVSLLLSFFAIIIAIIFLFAKNVAVDEAGTPREIQNLESGYWLWLISMIIMLIGNCRIYYLNYSSKNTKK